MVKALGGHLPSGRLPSNTEDPATDTHSDDKDEVQNHGAESKQGDKKKKNMYHVSPLLQNCGTGKISLYLQKADQGLSGAWHGGFSKELLGVMRRFCISLWGDHMTYTLVKTAVQGEHI